MLGFAVLCNGGGYANRPPKFIAMSALLPVALALLMLNHVRYAAPYGYALSCAKFTTPIVALAGYLADSVQWATAGWRLLNILLGIGLDLAAATLVLPVTSRAATRRRVQVGALHARRRPNCPNHRPRQPGCGWRCTQQNTRAEARGRSLCLLAWHPAADALAAETSFFGFLLWLFVI
jgi:hypothetical protein